MINFDKAPQTAQEYIADLSERFGVIGPNKLSAKKPLNKIWENWEKQGVKKPIDCSDFKVAIDNPYTLFEQYFTDIVSVNDDLQDLNHIHYFQFPWYEFNAATNTLVNHEKVILFDSHLMAFLNSVAITIMTCVYTNPRNDQIQYYESFVLERFEEFINKSKSSDDRDIENFSKKFQSIASVDYELTHAGASCAVAFNAFILCHEIAHLKLQHTDGKRDFQYVLTKDSSPIFQVNNIQHQQEYEADTYGYQLFLNLIEKREHTKRIKLIESYQLMPLVFFELIDMVFCYAQKRGVKYCETNTHPHPLDRKRKLTEFIDGKHHPLANEFYDAFMEFSEHIRQRF